MPNPVAPVLTETLEPHEILMRYESGKYKGAHYQGKTVWRRDGQVVNEALGPAQPVKDVKGFTLADVMGQVAHDQQILIEEQSESLAAKDAEIATKDANFQRLLEQQVAVNADLDAALKDAAEAHENYRILLASLPAAAET